MTSSGVSAFGDPDDFETALRGIGTVELLAIGQRRFRARMTQIVLPHLRLSSVKEFQPRVAFVSPAPGTLRVLLPIDKSANLVCGGARVDPGEMVTHRTGLGIHERLTGPCRWGDILLPISHLDRYGRAVSGQLFSLSPGMRRWRPPSPALAHLAALHAAAMRITEAHPGIAAEREATHGLEQELTEALIECLSGASSRGETVSGRRHATLMARFEAVWRERHHGRLLVRDICAALGVSGRALRLCCKRHLDMAPDRYLRARRLQAVHRALRDADATEASVSAVARRHGFTEPGRFAASYRAQFGELPSATLRG
jgi:AraC-like DNA-binding protein